MAVPCALKRLLPLVGTIEHGASPSQDMNTVHPLAGTEVGNVSEQAAEQLNGIALLLSPETAV
jgi:hypothetical protein